MDKLTYTLLGAVCGFAYASFESAFDYASYRDINIPVFIMIVITGALIGNAKWYAKERKNREYEELLEKINAASEDVLK